MSWEDVLRAQVDDSRLLMDIVQAVLDRESAAEWSVDSGEFWCYLSPAGQAGADQGWKLHVSATLLSAPVVLARAAQVLVRAGCPFKFTRGLDQLGTLLAANCDRGRGGKFITVYPADDDRFHKLASELDRVTDGLPGPVILSDRRFRPGSNVFYRYGVFGAPRVLTNDGNFESMLTAPEGQLRRDERNAWFSPPPWATSPLPAPKSNGGKPTAPAAVLIGDRFVVREAIRHSYRGGVFRATDQLTGADVILKQARPHVAGHLNGDDAQDMLRHEADILDLLGPLEVTPRKVDLVTHQENLFLVEDLVPGVTLRGWAADHSLKWHARGAPLAEAVDKAGRLIEVMAAVHAQGLVLSDFTPNNIMVMPDDRLRLIDVEHVARTGSRVVQAFTPGYAAPERQLAPSFGPAPAPESDLYSLGATILHLISGTSPFLPADEPAERPGDERIANLVDHLAASMTAVRQLSPMVLGLMRDEPDQRWSLTRSRQFLAAVGEQPVSQPPDPQVDRLIVDGLDHMLRTMAPEARRLWSGNQSGDQADPCNVQHGAGGVLHVLTRGAQALGHDRSRAGVEKVAGWIQQRLFDVPTVLPGLYFGRSGTAWALHDAAILLGDETMAGQALELAKQVPLDWPNPDICHGAAGAGMLQLHLLRTTGDPELEQRAIRAADSVLRAARERAGQLIWPIPETFDSTLAGVVHYGFAHGVAGAGTFLLYSSLATGRREYLEAAVGAGETLAAVVEIDDGAAWWPTSPGDPARSGMFHWCSGSSGIGTFLIRLWLATDDERFRGLAEMAGAAVHLGRWQCGTTACHGLAGNGDFLLDLADFTGEQRYHEWAGEIAAALHARNTVRDGLMVLPEESNAKVHPGYNTGLAGAVDFLMRLRHGGRRSWLLDEQFHTPRQPQE